MGGVLGLLGVGPLRGLGSARLLEVPEVDVEHLYEERGVLVGHLARIGDLERSLQALEYALRVAARLVGVQIPEEE